MPSCSMGGCYNSSSNSKEKGLKVWFHRLPDKTKYPRIYSLWCSAMNHKDLTNSENYRICSTHFDESDYEASSLLRNKLLGP
jgi:hypothetical protein